MKIDIKVKTLKANDYEQFFLKKKKVNKCYAFYNREGDKVSKIFTPDEFNKNNILVSQYIRNHNKKISNNITDKEISLIKLIRKKFKYKTIDKYYLILKKLSDSIKFEINKLINFLGEIK